MKTPVNIFWNRRTIPVVIIFGISVFVLMVVLLAVYFVPLQSEQARTVAAFAVLMGAGTAALSAIGYAVIVAQALLLEIRGFNQRLSR